MASVREKREDLVEVEVISNFQINPFVRKRWFSREKRSEWKEKVCLAKEAYRELEFLTVEAGIRKCTTRNIRPENLSSFQEELAERDLYFQPIRKIGTYTGAAGFHTDPDSTEGWKFYGAVGSSLDAAEKFVEASADPEAQASGGPGGRANHRILGELLGYPECCIEFFEKYFVGQNLTDPHWDIALNTGEDLLVSMENDTITLKEVPWQTNVLMRCEQLKITPHFPCSFDCKKSLEVAEEWFALGQENNLDGIEELKEILNLPVRWSCSKGVANIRTPYFEIQSNSQTTHPKVDVVLEREAEYS